MDLSFELVHWSEIPGCVDEPTIPDECSMVQNRVGKIEHARREEADMTNFNSFLNSEHWTDDFRDASTTPDAGTHGTGGPGGNGEGQNGGNGN